MTDKDKVIELIENRKETDFCDFKREFYHDSKKTDMIKDILAFANSTAYGDKYIIFNIDDKTRQLCKMKIDTIPDISEINGLLREYCEPYIWVDISYFSYREENVIYIKIPKDLLDRPYVVKKDYARGGKIFLQQGQVFIRRNSDNFRANRRDLDEIYELREKRNVQVYKDEIEEMEIVENNQIKKIFVLDFIFENNSKKNFLIEQIKIKFKNQNHCFLAYGKDLIDINNQRITKKNPINDVPISIEAYTTIIKKVRFELSDACVEKIKEYCLNGNELIVGLEISDTKKRTLCSKMKKCIFKFNE